MFNQRCLEGCLRCSDQNKCLYCNVQENYSLEFGRCIKREFTNCLKLNEKGRCDLCEPNYYLDNVSLRCIKLPQNLMVSNCLHHLRPGTCLQCNEKFYEKKGGCVEISSPVQNCKIENSRGECLKCKNEYIVSIDRKFCIQKPNVENCAGYSNIQCRSCSDGFLKNENFYLDYIFGFKNTQQFQHLTNYFYNVKNQVSDGFKFKTCQKTQVDNCLIFQTADRCKKCVEGFFVNRKFNCEKIPEPTISNCTKYSSLTSCIDCAQGYYLESSTQCSPINPIENCFLYDTSDNTSTCRQCTDNYYLSAENLCTSRSILSKIDFCEKLAIDFEKCTQCKNGYVPTSDKLRCLPVIENCAVYVVSNRTYLSLSCNTCEKGYFYNQEDKICIRGNIPNCEVYHLTKNECVQCEPLYFSVGHFCRPHQPIHSCDVYSRQNQDICERCDQHHFLFKTEHLCVEVDRIKNCEKYATKTTCQECEEGFYLTNPSVCELIPPKENCVRKIKQGDNFNCLKCRNGYVLSHNVCHLPFEHFRIGCENSNINGEKDFNEIKCENCSKNFVPLNFKDNYYCLEKDLLNNLIKLNSTLDNDCLQYYFNEDTNVSECIKCKKDMFLDDGKCLPNCQKSDRLTVYRQYISLHNLDGNDENESIRIEKTDTCEKTIPNCKFASLTIKQNMINPEYSCEECVSEYLSIIEFNEFSKSIVKHSYQNKKNEIQMPISFAPSVKCKNHNDFDNFVGDIIDVNNKKFIENCEYYYSVDNNTLGCFKCQIGFTGKIVSKVKNCLFYQNKNDCSKCEQGYYLKSPAECTVVNTILNCVNYDQIETSTICLECSSDFYLDTNTCLLRVDSYRKLHSTTSNIADSYVCIEGYSIVNNECRRMPEMCKEATQNGDILDCTLCDNQISYLDGTICKLGTITNCIKYNATDHTCLECQYNHYLLENKCILNLALPGMQSNINCSKFDQTTAFVCTECKNGSNLFEILNKCIPKVNENLNCLEWEDEYRCKNCNPGYYLNNLSKRCLIIPSENKCLIMKVKDISNNNLYELTDEVAPNKYTHDCIKCKPNYYLSTVNKTININNVLTQTDFTECNDYLDVMRSNCEIMNVNGEVNFAQGNGCSACKENFYPMDYRKKYICINRNYLSKKVPNFVADNSCKRYIFNGTIYLCEKCIYPKFLNESTGTCVSDCPDLTFKIILHLENNTTLKNNYCGTLPAGVTALDGCDQYIDSFVGDYVFNYKTAQANRDFVLTCAKCLPNKVPTFVFGENVQKTTFIDVNKGNDNYDFVHERVSLPIECLSNEIVGSPNVDRVKGLKNSTTKLIDNCELYTKLHAAEDFYGCFKCKWGFTGRVNNYAYFDDPNTNYFGYIEYCLEMTDCDKTVKYGGLHFNTEFIKFNGSINNYFTCHKCTGTKKLVSFYNWDIAATSTANIIGLQGFKYNSHKDGSTTSETNIREDLSNVLMCIEETELLNADAADPDGNKFKVFEGSSGLNTNCGLRIVNTKNIGTISPGSLQCLICEPGYFAVLDETTKLLGACTLITGLDAADLTSEKNFNNRSTCTFNYDIFLKKVDYELCYANVITNCLAGYLDPIDISTDKCGICEKGYELVNNDTVCLKILTPNCNSTNYKKNKNITFKKEFLEINYFIHLQSEVEGCTECSKLDDTLVLHNMDDNIDNFICATPYLNQFNSITNCQIIGWVNEKIVCKQCSTNYLLVGDDKCLLSATYNVNLPFCAKTKDEFGSICDECIPDGVDNYLNIGGWCTIIKANSINTEEAVDNCLKYNLPLSKLYIKAACEKCEGNYYAQSTEPYNCILIPVLNCIDFNETDGCTNCKRGFGLINKLNDMDVSEKICIPLNSEIITDNFDHDNDCMELEVEGDNVVQQFKLRCKKCENGVLKEINTVKSQTKWCYSVFKQTGFCDEYQKSDPFVLNTSKLHCTSCADQNVQYFNLNNRECPNRSTISFCQEYEEKINRCAVCDFGYMLDETAENCLPVGGVGVGKGYIQTCRKMNECDGTIHYDGLSADLSSIFSCHQCVKPNEIPIAAAEFDLKLDRPGFYKIKNLSRFSYKDSTTKYNELDGNESVVQCMEINSINLGISDSSLLTFPDNCGLAFTKVNNTSKNSSLNLETNITNLDHITVTCTACKPGFAPQFSESTQSITSRVNYMVSNCTAIPNCQFSKWFNACTQCNPNYTFGYDKETGVNFSKCVEYEENPNCFSVETIVLSSGTLKKCNFCKKGSYLNKDGYCEMIKPNRCKYQEFKFRQFFSKNDINIALHDYTKNVGCSECEAGFIAVYSDKDKFICTHSLYHSENLLPPNTFYKLNCDNYSINKKGHLICRKCSEGFVVSENGDCLIQTNLANCKVSCDSNLCAICKEGFILVNRACVEGTIENCEIYGNNKILHDKNCNMDGLEKQVCIKCQDEYYLNSGICSKGEVPNCKDMETKYICNECQENFTLTEMKNGRSYCYPVDKRFNCKRFDSKKFQSSILNCEECIEDNYIKSESHTDFFETSCMKFNKEDNCLRYDNNPIALADSSFVCVECNKETYLSNKNCLLRMTKPEECSKFDGFADRCLECHVGYFLSLDGTSCIPYPQGLNGCRIYRTKTTCRECEAGKYLREGLCLDITVEIPNCLYYEDEMICSVCLPTFLNIKGNCVQALARECLEYEGLNACKTCRKGFGLKLEEGLLNCVQQSIQNCVSFEIIEPYKCIQCDPEFYSNSDGECVAVTTQIQNCLVYSDKDICQKCAKGSALSQDKLNCLFTPDVISNLDRDCVDNIIPLLPICNTCKPGYRFVYGKCIACKQELIDSGCGNCHPDFPDICLICSNGWIQTPEGTCTRPLIETSGIAF